MNSLLYDYVASAAEKETDALGTLGYHGNANKSDDFLKDVVSKSSILEENCR